MTSFRQTKIVATLGPASESPGILQELIQAGVDIFRLNFSHGDLEEKARQIAEVRRLARETDRIVGILQDLQGPKIRVGSIKHGTTVLRQGAVVTISPDQEHGTDEAFSISFRDLPRYVRPGDSIFLDDGLLELRVMAIAGAEIRTEVITGGELSSRKGVNAPGIPIQLPAFTEKDEQDLRFGLQQGIDFLALSFVRRPEDADRVRNVMRELGAGVPLIAKVEKLEALSNLDAVLKAFDSVMVARGDLGVELTPEKVPAAQKMIIARARALGKPAITATQMLESMTRSPHPTRAEASDIANAVLDGTDAVMLSGETAAGAYPVEAVRAMDRIVREAESLPVRPVVIEPESRSEEHAVCEAAVGLAEQVNAAALAALTRSGRTAQTLSSLWPRMPIFSLIREHEALSRRLLLWRGRGPLPRKR